MSEVALRLLDLGTQAIAALVNRPKLSVRIIEDDTRCELGGLTFEVENRRRLVTSLLPEVQCTYYYLEGDEIRRGLVKYFVREVDRRLEPFSPRVLHATHDARIAIFVFTWLRTYRFRATSGFGTRVRVRNCFLEPLSRSRFVVELFRLRAFGRVSRSGPDTIDEYDRLRRSQGPH